MGCIIKNKKKMWRTKYKKKYNKYHNWDKISKKKI